MLVLKSRVIAALGICALALPPLGVRAQDVAEQITVSHPNPTTTVWKVFAPDVKHKEYYHRGIAFHPGDEIRISASGCVQTGGSGRTWKSYVYPSGGSADTYYSGTIYIPGVIPLGADGFQRIGGFVGKRLFVPDVLPPTIKPSDLVLGLGYQDDQYDDNGYYSHDDGNNDQCKNVGPAVVFITVISHPAVKAAAWTPWSRPFDLTWHPESIDANGLPVNPMWAGQIDPKGGGGGDTSRQLPDFNAACGPAFSWSYGNHGMVEDGGKLAAKCTSQSPTADFSGSVWTEPGPGSFCHPEPMSGHLNWMYATFSGTLAWVDYAGGWPHDGDIDLNLATEGGASQTTLNGGALGLEFNKSETLDNFSTGFWKHLRDTVDHGSDADVAHILDSNFVIATGLVGIDGVHGGYTELHPVTSMAICIQGCTVEKTGGASPPVIYGADQTWVFFLANFGAEGDCSDSEHYWAGLSHNGGNPWYFISLPWHPGATAVHTVSHTVWTGTPDLKTADAKHWRGWTYLGFQLPPPGPNAQNQLDGMVVLHYDVPPGGPKPHAAPPSSAARGHLDEDADFSAMEAAIRDTTARARLNALVKAMPAPQVLVRPNTRQVVLVANPEADVALATLTPERAAQPTRDHSAIDPVRSKRRSDFYLAAAPLLRAGVVTPVAPRVGLPKLSP